MSNEAQYRLRQTNGKAEMQWLVMVVEPEGTDHEWCESEALATKYGEEALRNAKDGDYKVSVYVLKCIKQNG